MKKAVSIEENTWLKKMSLIFFLMLCLVLPLGTSLQILTPWSFVDGHMLNFTTFFIYGTDILVLLMLFFWKMDVLVKFWKYGDWDDWKISVGSAGVIILFWVFCLWSSYSMFWAFNGVIAAYKALRLWELFFIFLYILLVIAKTKLIWKYVWGFLTGGIIIQAVWGILQYWRQDDFGLWRLGESDIGKEVLGVAKIDVLGEKIVRAYGSLGHANLYSFFMLAGLILVLMGILYCRGRSLCLPWEPAGRAVGAHTGVRPYIWAILLSIISIGCLVGFSRSVWVAGVMVFAGFMIEYYRRGTLLRAQSIGHNIKLFLFYLSIMAIAIYSNWQAIWTRLATGENLAEDVSFNVRTFLDQAADWMIDKVYYIGVGIGNFVTVLPYYSDEPLSWWMYQPVHNVFKLIWSEIGIIGLTIYVAILLLVGIKIFFSKTKNYPQYFWISVFVAFIWLHFFDHYMWDVWPGQLLFVFALVMLMISVNKMEYKKG